MSKIVSFISYMVILFAVTNDMYFGKTGKGEKYNEEYMYPLFI